ncbi:AAA family ATPase, partial [Campylobacter sp. 9BO]|uniref:AAA family ATPase n=1 Tax=Campylobacter sp. 9BO TaxID=3424759 RepID=UPI003D3407AB
ENIFMFLKGSALSKNDFEKEHEFLIEGFLPSELITMIYASGGSGKTFLSLAITKQLSQSGKRVFYLDFDNPVSVLKDRRVDELLIQQFENLSYIQRSSLAISPYELVMKLEENAVKGVYKECVFILDSLVNFCDLFNDNRLMRLFDALKNMREAGATIILHHSNKDGKNYQGSTCIKNAIDCMYKLYQKPSRDGELNFFLEVAKERAAIVDSGFCVEISSLNLRELDLSVAEMSEYEFTFTNAALKVLDNKELSKTELLNALGHEKDDKTARECLDKFDGVLWQSVKRGKSIMYSCLKDDDISTTLQPSENLAQNLLFDDDERVINE